MCDSTLFPTKGLGTRLTVAQIIFAVYSVAVPVSQRICSGPRICSGGTNTLADLFRFS